MGKHEALRYRAPDDWFKFDARAMAAKIADAVAAVRTLNSLPFEAAWVEESEADQLRAESLATGEGLEAGAAVETTRHALYAWISSLPLSTDFSIDLLKEIHSRLGAGPPGFRAKGTQAYFGRPLQRGAKGGRECRESVQALAAALATTDAPMLVQATAVHYHVLAIHPFADANSRVARAVDALFRRKSGLSGPHFVAMNDFYLSAPEAYAAALSGARRAGHDLTPLLNLALPALTARVSRITERLRGRLARAIYENTMDRLFGGLANGKRRAMAARQAELLRIALADPGLAHDRLYERLRGAYANLKNPWKAFLRDVHDLLQIGAVEMRGGTEPAVYAALDWPASITEAAFLQHYRDEPRSGVVLSAVV